MIINQPIRKAVAMNIMKYNPKIRIDLKVYNAKQ